MKDGDRSGQERVTVSLTPGRLQHVKARVAQGDAPSVSAYIDRMLARDEQATGLRQVLDEMDREYGNPSAADQAWARQVLGV